MSEPCLHADRLTKAYGRHAALRGVSLSVHPGEVVGLLGPNGAGKTTTVKIVIGLVTPSSGTARLFGLPSRDPRARARLGYLPELFRFPDWMTGEAVLALHADLAGVERAQRKARISDALERVGLGARGRDRVRGYSKGMSQRLGLAQALIGRPELLILDEPTSALDPVGRREVRDLVAELKADGVAVLLNSHLLSEIERLCDRVTVLERGHVRFEGTLTDLTAAGRRIEVLIARPDEQVLARLAELGRVTRGERASEATPFGVSLEPPWDEAPAEAAERIAALVATGGWGLRGLTIGRASLEDVFVDMVTGGDR